MGIIKGRFGIMGVFGEDYDRLVLEEFDIIMESVHASNLLVFDGIELHFEFYYDGAYFDVDFSETTIHPNTYRIDFDDRAPKVVRSSISAVHGVFDRVGGMILDFAGVHGCNIAIPYPLEDVTRGKVYGRLARRLGEILGVGVSEVIDGGYGYYIVRSGS